MNPKPKIRNLRSSYRSGKANIGTEFFRQCLGECSLYRRASAFFTSRVLVTWADALPRLAVSPETTIRLLIAPILSKEDKSALAKVMEEESRMILLQKVVDDMVQSALAFADAPENNKLRIELFSWLVATNRLDIRFAFPKQAEDADLFHEKIGVFDFPWGDQVAFTGSANETLSGHYRNWESIDVYRSWHPTETDRVLEKIDQFDEAFERRIEDLSVHAISPSILEKIKERAPSGAPKRPDPQKDNSVVDTTNKWRHQDEAVELFLERKRGVLEMATGTGKTWTALKIIYKLYSSNLIEGVIVATSGTDLLKQWLEELLEFIKKHNSFSLYSHFESHHEIEKFASHPENSILVVSRQQLHKLIGVLPIESRSKLLIIHDEVHGLGSLGNIHKLSGEHKHFQYVLGMSATPEREYDQAGSHFILNELGKVFFTFDLKDAIRRGILCEFDYIPLTYELTSNDKERLQAVYKARAARKASGDPMPDSELWTRLSAVYKTAEKKPSIFKLYLENNSDILSSSIIFVHTKEYGERLLELIHHHTSNYGTYYDDDNPERLQEFREGKLDTLITCHRISQGIDIKRIENIILLSSDRSRLETIQRIGRCLRVDPNNPKKKAKVLDFIKTGDDGSNIDTADEMRRAWLTDLSITKWEV